jgi:hypothetical protein
MNEYELTILDRANKYIITCLDTVNVRLVHSPIFYLESSRNIKQDRNFLRLLYLLFCDAIDKILANDVEEQAVPTCVAATTRNALQQELAEAALLRKEGENDEK